MKTDYDILLDKYHDELIDSLKKFVSINSVYDEKTSSFEHPFGIGVSKALNFIHELAIKDGFKSINYGNKVVEILCGEQEKNITILAHADVVPEGEGWEQNPFEVVEKDGVLLGRGVADDKGPLLASYYAMKVLRDNNLLGNYQVRFIVGGNEESGSLGVEYYFNELKSKQPTLGFSPDAEFPLIYAEKGIYTFEARTDLELDGIISFKGGLAANSVIEKCILSVDKNSKFLEIINQCKYPYSLADKGNKVEVIIQGVSAHGASPKFGKNAGVEALRLIALATNNKVISHIYDCLHDLEGRGIDAYCYSDNMECSSSMNVGIVNYDGKSLSIVINYRYVDTCNIDETKIKIANKIAPFKIVSGGDSHLLFYKKDSDLVRILLDSYQKETGDYDSKPMAIGGGTYAKEANNIIAFGAEFPGWNSNMHSIGEGMKKEHLFKAMSVYARAIVELGKFIDEN